ncbi:substrate of the Dot/Icm secretion system [Legionella sainthelensi]|uniref:Substrate of the Dot/Icm secretion system n=1 Tax=Legionella sainthelensi TaxID=28087 RepID=A0A0W0YDQ7_9GAMM|nr:hypothetical protein [Legionella sainthelensi]KTD55080.1 substrate of the Dot/Icm secretion system [Legionella sainthelensi]VEH36635.1 substrate of the Dot/Icm secretion system [Legionella sainthelensi]
MAISKEFFRIFGHFVMNYKQNGTPAFYNWAKEHNHNIISLFLEEILSIVTLNQDTLHDASIIENLSITILLSAKSNPYLLNCWVNFLDEYNIAAKQYAPIGTIEMSIGPSGAPSENLIRNLKDALIAQQAAFVSTQKIHQVEIEQLKKQISDLQQSHNQLILQNDQLKTLVGDRKTVEEMHAQIITAQNQLLSVSQLLGTLYETTKQKPVIEILSPLPTAPMMLPLQTPELGQLAQASSDKTVEKDRVMEHEICVIPSQIEVPVQKEQLQSRVTPPPPIPLPSEKPSTLIKETKTEIKPILANQSFFAPLNNNELLNGINGALEKMKKRKEAQASQINEEEKKKLSTQ